MIRSEKVYKAQSKKPIFGSPKGQIYRIAKIENQYLIYSDTDWYFYFDTLKEDEIKSNFTKLKYFTNLNYKKV